MENIYPWFQGNDEDDDTLAGTSDGTFTAGSSDPDPKRTSPDVVETYSSDLRPNEDEIQLLRLKLEEAQCKNRVIEEEMHNLKSKVSIFFNFKILDIRNLNISLVSYD